MATSILDDLHNSDRSDHREIVSDYVRMAQLGQQDGYATTKEGLGLQQ